MTKSLPVEQYGLWSQLGVASGVLLIFALAGLDSATLRFLSGERDHTKDSSFTAATLLSVTIGALITLACTIAALTLADEHASLRPGIAAAGLLVLGLVVERFALIQLRRLLLIWPLTLATISLALTEIVFISASLGMGSGVPGAMVAWAIAKLLVGGGVLLYSGLFLTALARPNSARLPQLIGFGLPAVGTGLLIWVLNLSDRFLIGWLVGLGDVARYSASFALGGAIALPFGPVSLLVIPKAASLWENGKRAEAQALLSRGLERSVWLAAPLLVVLVAWAPELLAAFTIPEYSVAAASLAIVAVGLFVQAAAIFGETELALIRHSRSLILPFFVAAITNVGANLTLLPIFGYTGAAVATMISGFTHATIVYARLRIVRGWQLEFHSTAIAISLAVGAITLIAGTRSMGHAVMVTITLVCGVVYAAAWWRAVWVPHCAHPRGM